jgi:hypothetical protein
MEYIYQESTTIKIVFEVWVMVVPEHYNNVAVIVVP